MTIGQRRGLRLGPAIWMAVLAVLTLLMSPGLAGRAHAAMLTAGPEPAAMSGMADMGRPTVAAPCHHDVGAACSIACALASQLLPPSASDAPSRLGEAGAATYARTEATPAGASPERSTPPPR